MFRNGLIAVTVAVGAMTFGSTTAKADHRGRSCGAGVGYAPSYYAPSYYAPSYYAPVYAPAPVVYAPPVVSYAAPVSYYRPVTYVRSPVYYPPVHAQHSYYAPVRYSTSFYRPSGISFGYASRHRGFSFSVGH